MVNLELYRVFYYVASLQSITKAASSLYISQPAVSQSIKALETQLGSRLFVRTNKGMELTDPEGITLFGYVKKAIGLFEEGENSIASYQNIAEGTLRITVSDSLFKHFLKDKIFAFMKKYPDINVVCENRTTSESISFLKSSKVDIGIISLPQKDTDLNIVTSSLKLNYILVGTKEFSHLSKTIINLKEISAYPLIMLDSSSSATKSFQDFFYSQGVELTPEIELGSLDLVADFAKMGGRLALIPREYVQKELQNGELIEVPTDPAFPVRTLGIATYKKSTHSFATKTFLEVLLK